MRGPEIEGRPARKRGARRAFRPNYLSFNGTYACNLSCAHCCVPIEWEDRLEVAAAVRFLESAHEAGIRILGFTGGEPFIYPEFVIAVARRAVELSTEDAKRTTSEACDPGGARAASRGSGTAPKARGGRELSRKDKLGGWRFDKVMTNGTWYEDRAHLERVLRELRDTGYSGRIGLSVDKFHPVKTERLALFCEVVADVFERDDILAINYASAARAKGLERVEALARALGGTVGWSDLLGGHMLVTDRLSATLHWNHLAPVERAERLGGGFDGGPWFEEDFCEGPGQALIVTPKGEVKPCCGFASDLDQLTIGSIYEHSAEETIARARRHPYVGKLFREGLTAIRAEVLAAHPDAVPGPTSNHCFFCWYALTRGLVEGLPGGGGKVGAWISPAPGVPAPAVAHLKKLPLVEGR
jgi:hypothetical protein